MAGRGHDRAPSPPGDRIPLGHFPTPIEHVPWLSEELGVALFVKREDLSGLLLGGNKVRKLEYVAADPALRNASVWLTTGGPQSNHARETAAAAVRLRKRALLFLTGGRPSKVPNGNLLLFEALGADLRFLPGADEASVAEAMEVERRALTAQGQAAAVIPVGAATGRGALAWVDAFDEIAAQFRPRVEIDHIVVPTGTGSTATGLALGAARAGRSCQVWGISVNWAREKLERVSRELVEEAAPLAGCEAAIERALAQLRFDDRQVGPGYTEPTPAAVETLELLARRGGILGDLTYTAKGFAGLRQLVGETVIARGQVVLYVHTGTTPDLFARGASERALVTAGGSLSAG